MKLNLKDKQGYTIETKDGLVGTVRDFLFDEKKWTLRYLHVDIGGFFRSKRVLIPVQTIENTSWINEKFELSIHAKRFKTLPDSSKIKSISREVESKLLKHFKVAKYWKRKYIKSMSKPTLLAPAEVMVIDTEYASRIPFDSIKADDSNSKVKCLNQIKDFEVFAQDGKAGRVVDLIFDSKDWRVLSLIIQTDKHTSFDERIILPLNKIQRINYVEKGLVLSITLEELELSDSFDEGESINKKKVIKQFDFTGKPISA